MDGDAPQSQVKWYYPFHYQGRPISNCSCSPTRNIASHRIKNLDFHTYSDERWLYYQFSLPHLYISLQKGWENVLFWTWEWKGSTCSRSSANIWTRYHSGVGRLIERLLNSLLKISKRVFNGYLFFRLKARTRPKPNSNLFEVELRCDQGSFRIQSAPNHSSKVCLAFLLSNAAE